MNDENMELEDLFNGFISDLKKSNNDKIFNSELEEYLNSIKFLVYLNIEKLENEYYRKEINDNIKNIR